MSWDWILMKKRLKIETELFKSNFAFKLEIFNKEYYDFEEQA